MGEKILVVEDEPLTRSNISELLRNKGYEVTEAKDGAEAAELLGDQGFDLVIADFVIPKIHGLDLVDLIRSRWPSLRIMIISGYLSASARKVILEGYADFIQKPVDADTLLSRVRLLLLPARRLH
ncbi:MAG: response regulator [Candidatus Binatia bacterium]